jgi:SOS response associated peptidase (SRAP)
MCKLYSITTNQEAIRRLFRKVKRYVGNLAPMPGVFPDYPAPVIRNASDGAELAMMRWGMPAPPRNGGPLVTNIRNTSSPHWRGGLKQEHRCLVPFNSSRNTPQSPILRPRKRTLSGSHSTTIGRSPPSPGSGPGSGATATPNRSRSRAAPGLRLPDDVAERGGRANPREGDAP